ncbi:hypothetical protein PIIN_07992 [Serendipita indica DSM 11827]|uniref:Uncharacterized protein n=1 Tax=Serendipita indica (strain DSM 11827) TaxID=1109443 RepID=G4TRU5_SERID|nr:hypothetical protein PIIN_07992 [Serendipita indica DSM 11827]
MGADIPIVGGHRPRSSSSSRFEVEPVRNWSQHSNNVSRVESENCSFTHHDARSDMSISSVQDNRGSDPLHFSATNDKDSTYGNPFSTQTFAIDPNVPVQGSIPWFEAVSGKYHPQYRPLLTAILRVGGRPDNIYKNVPIDSVRTQYREQEMAAGRAFSEVAFHYIVNQAHTNFVVRKSVSLRIRYISLSPPGSRAETTVNVDYDVPPMFKPLLVAIHTASPTGGNHAFLGDVAHILDWKDCKAARASNANQYISFACDWGIVSVFGQKPHEMARILVAPLPKTNIVPQTSADTSQRESASSAQYLPQDDGAGPYQPGSRIRSRSLFSIPHPDTWVDGRQRAASVSNADAEEYKFMQDEAPTNHAHGDDTHVPTPAAPDGYPKQYEPLFSTLLKDSPLLRRTPSRGEKCQPFPSRL